MGFMKLVICAGVICAISWVALHWIKEESFSPEDQVNGKNVIVTGASSGIGRETALLACEMGANVFITARREKLLQQVIEICRKTGRKGAKYGYFAADMKDMDQAESVVLKAAHLFGGIDFLILNHGAFGLEFIDYKKSDFQDIVDGYNANFFSMIKMTITAMPYLKKSHGRICVVSSVSGEIPSFFGSTTTYFGTKYSVTGFFTSLEHEHFVKGINVSITVAILGFIDTPMLKQGFDQVNARGYDVSPEDTGVVPVSSRDCANQLIKQTAMRKTKFSFPDLFIFKYMSFAGRYFPEYFKHNILIQPLR